MNAFPASCGITRNASTSPAPNNSTSPVAAGATPETTSLENDRTQQSLPFEVEDRGQEGFADTVQEFASMAVDEEKAALERDQAAEQSTSENLQTAVEQERVNQERERTREFFDAPETTDPEKEAIQKDIQNKHLSLASSADWHKRESIETAPRASTVLSDSASETSQTGDDDPKLEGQDSRPGGRSRVTLAVPDDDPNARRPTHSRGDTVASGITVASSRRSGRSMPSLRRRETKLAQKKAHPWQHLGITLGLPMILLFDLVVPCIIYYVWFDHHRRERDRNCQEERDRTGSCSIPLLNYDKDILGFAIISFGFGELWILIARVHRLWVHRDACAPLLSRSRWELDATSWVYGVALIMGLIPFVVGSELEIPQLYLYSPSFIMAFLGALMVLTTLVPIKIPIGINSHARGSRIRPFIYYAAEDFIAVDGLQDREFRVRYNDRYETNRRFRRFFVYLTLFWIWGVIVYIGCASAIIWNLEFHYAFGLTFGILFTWIFVWAGMTAIWVKREMKAEHEEYENDEVEA
ncbi:hypothetical protein HII31_04218 [Pseudocercospora fuligena]|uniref:Uncharacterized protein n=1 Tax=Pseudocercospora fuligena TaxID=685502 RepID=A0A8H6VJ55_9PEZI|nr:hypothetical protein HII31_04218 [Pseudocercospora fuligena]